MRSQAGRAVLANLESNTNNANNVCGKRKAQRSSSIVAEPAIGVVNEVTTSLCGIHGQTLLSPAAAALCNNYDNDFNNSVHLCVSMHNVLADMGLQVLVASRSAKTNMRAYAGI